ncbi:MAG: slyA [Acidimicrobiaceae bacterium]|jgi:DNA-binding MarR family transcriptional regulator|nr:slyA [Acidimicrobiaceae bacterium]
MGRRDADQVHGNRDEAGGEAGAALYALVVATVRRVPRDMSLTSGSTLSTLERTGPRRVTDLAVIQGVTQPSMTVLVRALERDGLVERKGDPTDKRVSLVALTDAGSSYVHARRQAGIAALRQLIDKLTSDEAGSLAAAIPALERLRELDDEGREPGARSPSGAGGPRGSGR